MELYQQEAGVLAALIRKREVSCREVTGAILARIDQLEPRVQAFITVCHEAALAQSNARDSELAAGVEPGPLFGVPVAIKDNLSTQGVLTTAGSRILKGYHPPYDATVVARLKAAGAIILGKTNLDEFAMGSSTENSAYFATHNPWNLDRVPGGSSGGSAAAVAAGEVPLALGSDTGGSIRQPASFCGIVGLKPSYGRVSRYGLLAFASSLDQVGPLARSVSDAAALLQVIAGPDVHDGTCVPRPAPAFSDSLRVDVKGLRVGVPREMLEEGVAPGVREAVLAALQVLVGQGATLVELSMPTLSHTLPVYYILAPAEASSNLARYDGVEFGHRAARSRDTLDMYMASRDEGFGPEVKQRILVGTYALSAGYYDAYYLKAQKVRTVVRQEFARAFQQCDIIAGPTAPTPAFAIGEKVNDSLEMKRGDVLTIPANIAGLPAISVPCGVVDGLPVGLQLLGQAFDEETVLRCAYTFEQLTEHGRQRAALFHA